MTITRRAFFPLLLLARREQAGAFQVRVLEAFAINDACSAVLVHHSDSRSRDAFAQQLQTYPRRNVRIRTNAGAEVAAMMFRVRMCFGRGLILLKEPLAIQERELITVLT